MKKNLCFLLIALALSSAMGAHAFSQYAVSAASGFDKKGSSGGTSFRSAGIDADKMALAGLKASSTKLFNHFSRNFKTASDIRISSVGNQTQINFTMDGTSHSARYDKKGRWMFSVSTYAEEKMDEDVRRDVESAFPGYLVFGFVTDVKVLDKTARLVMIENKKSWKRVRLVDGEISIYEEYTKQ